MQRSPVRLPAWCNPSPNPKILGGALYTPLSLGSLIDVSIRFSRVVNFVFCSGTLPMIERQLYCLGTYPTFGATPFVLDIRIFVASAVADGHSTTYRPPVLALSVRTNGYLSTG